MPSVPSPAVASAELPKKKRGRPAKTEVTTTAEAPAAQPKKRGRPAKVKTEPTPCTAQPTEQPPIPQFTMAELLAAVKAQTGVHATPSAKRLRGKKQNHLAAIPSTGPKPTTDAENEMLGREVLVFFC